MKVPKPTGLILAGFAGLALVASLMPAQQNAAPQAPKRKKLLIIAQTKGYTHDSITHGASVVEQMEDSRASTTPTSAPIASW